MDLTEAKYQAVVNGMADHYVGMMSGRDYQVVGRSLEVPSSDRPLGIMRVNFDDRIIYSQDVDDGSAASFKRELVAGEFCDHALMSLADYSCDPDVGVPLAEIEAVEDLEYDLYFESEEVKNSVEAQIFFEDVFGVEDWEDEFEVRTLG